jgi:hypothetical protein
MDLVTWVLLGALCLGVLVALEGRRQSRHVERRGQRPSLIGVGALELQKLLQPDRKVEIVLQETREQDRLHPDHRPGSPADLPKESDDA